MLSGGNPQIAKADGDAPVQAYIAGLQGWRSSAGLRCVRRQGGTGKDSRWVDLHEGAFDEAKLVAWIRQAAKLPGWIP